MFGFSNWRPALMAATFIVLLPGAMAESVRIPYAPPVLPIPDLIKSSVSEIRILDKQGQLVKKFTDRGKTIYSYEQGRRIAAVSDDGRIGTYEYDARNRLKRSVWSTGEKREYHYDESSGALARIENVDGSSITIKRIYGRKPTVIFYRADGSRSIDPGLADRIARLAGERRVRIFHLEHAVASAEGDKKCDNSGCETEGGGGKNDSEDQGGTGSQSNPESPPEKPENTVEVPGTSCTANPYQKGCPPENPIDWDDIAEEDVPGGGGGEEDWKGPEGCRRHLVEICREDAWVAHQEGIKQCMKFMKKKQTRRQCIENEIQLYADMLVQCEENLRCRK